ncbi:MAG: hypothetical protein KA146_06175 [Leptospiraceae bacterium]|nr:hypothetical protein [Leptospiraceae bacterium]
MPNEKKDNIVSMKDFNQAEEIKAMKSSIIGMSKQIEITIETTNKIIERYNSVVNHQQELSMHIENLYMDNRLMKNILNQLKGFFEKSFPGYANDPHFTIIRQLSELLIDSSEEGIQRKREFFEQAAKANEAQTTKA